MTFINNVFACGEPAKDHKCDEKGGVLILANHSTVKDTPENRIQYKEQERGWSQACSVCDQSQFHMDLYG